MQKESGGDRAVRGLGLGVGDWSLAEFFAIGAALVARSGQLVSKSADFQFHNRLVNWG